MVQESNIAELIIERVGDSEIPVIATVSTSDGSATGRHFISQYIEVNHWFI